MSDFKVNSIATKQGQHGPVIAGVSTINSTGCMKIPSGPTEFRGGRGRGVVAGGQQASPVGTVNTMEFIEIATTGNATDFGDFNQSPYFGGTGFASATRGLFAGGYNPTAGITDIGFFTFSSNGGATGSSGSNTNVIDSVTIASTGNASDFGDMTYASGGSRGCFANSDSHGGIGL